MIKNSDHNDSWSVLLIVETYKSPSSWTQIPYRHLYAELTILHSNKEYEGSSLNAQIDRVEKRDQYLKQHMPEYFNSFQSIKNISFFVSWFISILMIYGLHQKISASNYLVYLPIFLVFRVLVIVNSLIAGGNAMLPSRLTIAGLPNNMKIGLLNEIREHIQYQIASHVALLPKREPRVEEKHSALPPVLSKPKIKTVPDAAPIVEEISDIKIAKTKRRDHYPSLNYSLEDTTPLHQWNTKKYGKIAFRPGRVSDVIGLWAATKYGKKSKFDDRYAVLYPLKQLEQEAGRRQIISFWQTAAFGRIVHKQNETGYVVITDKEKANPNYKLPQNAVFKIKSFHAEEERYRQPIVPCEVEDTDENSIELLVALRPVRTHAGDA